MKKLKINIVLILCMLLMSCAEEGSVSIVSLNTFGTKFCRNDVVKVFVIDNKADNMHVHYEWGCDAGKFTNPQGLFENIWVAPDKAGTYDIWCTATCGDEKETRHSNVVVTDELFYSNFETPYITEGWSNTAVTLAFEASKGNNGAAKLTSTSSGTGLFAKGFTSRPAPISMQIDYAVNTIVDNKSVVETVFEFDRIDNAMRYVKFVRFTTYPKTGKWEASYTAVDATLGKTFLTIISGGVDTEKFLFKKDTFKSIAASIDVDNNFIVYVDGNKFFESDILTTEQTSYVAVIAGLGLTSKVVLFADDFFIFDNGTICTATKRER